MPYTTVLFDLDHTLLDTDESERLAFAAAMEEAGATASPDWLARYRSINHELWKRVEQGELHPEEVRVSRFEQLVDDLGLKADAEVMASQFAAGLGALGPLYPGATSVLDALLGNVSLGLITNGLSDIQRARLTRLGLERYFSSIIISAEVGVAKPSPDIFAMALRDLGEPSRDDVLMVGDSLSSDMAGGRAAGIDTCWYNANGHVATADVTYEIAELSAVVGIVL